MEELHRQRLDRLSQALKEEGLTQMIVSDPLAIWYFTGVDVQPGERLFALYARADGGHKLILNKLFTVACTGLPEVWMTDTDDTVGILAQAVDPSADMGIDKNWPARFLLALMERNPGVRYVNSSGCVDRIRAVKDEDEQEKMRAASRINDACMEAAAAYLREGLTEKEVSEYVSKLYRDAGCEGLSFGTIVSFGAHAADPHHEPDNTALKKGDCIVIDMGCRKDRYCSDMTRTFYFQRASEEHRRIYDIVRSANETAISKIRPGIPLCELDKTARDLITEQGYGPFFTHRLGHFIGLGEHEFGDVSSVNTQKAEPGMIFSIEPGIYLAGDTGVRVEDLVLVTEDGCEVLNHDSKEFEIIG